MAGKVRPSDAELGKARIVLGRFNFWCQRNPEALRWLYKQALLYEAAGRRFSMKSLIERMRWDDVVTFERDGKTVSLPNVYAPILARCLILARPNLYTRDLLRVNPSVYDWLPLTNVFKEVR